MKKIILLVILPVFLFVICSCSLITEAMSIEITTLPKTVYSINEEMDDFVITVNFNDNSKQEVKYTKENNNGITVKGFITTSAGDKVCTIEYENLTVAFNYTVVNNTSFAGGAGTVDSPYLIENIEQLLAVTKNNKYVYYKLINNIDVESEYLTDKTLYAYLIGSFSGQFDGNNYKITMHSRAKEGLNDYQSYLFDAVSTTINANGPYVEAVVKNLAFEIDGPCTIARKADSASFKNISVYGGCFGTDITNYSLFVSYSDNIGKLSIRFENCKNYANVIGYNPYQAIFVGIPTFYSTDSNALVFDNCNNYGVIEGDSVAMFMANPYKLATEYFSENTKEKFNNNIVIRNCTNYGELQSFNGYRKDGKNTVIFAIDAPNTYAKEFSDYDTEKTLELKNNGVINNANCESVDFSNYYTLENNKIKLINNSTETLHMYVVVNGYASVDPKGPLKGYSGSLHISTKLKYDIIANGSITLDYNINAKLLYGENKYWTYENDNFYLDSKSLGLVDTDSEIIKCLSYRVFVYNNAGEIIGVFTVK